MLYSKLTVVLTTAETDSAIAELERAQGCISIASVRAHKEGWISADGPPLTPPFEISTIECDPSIAVPSGAFDKVDAPCTLVETEDG